MEVGEVRSATQEDFDKLLQLARGDNDDCWNVAVQKSRMTIWTRVNDISSFKMIKIRTEFTDVPAAVVYDVLHDADYRKKWDKNMIAGRELCVIDECNDVGYYSIRTPPPLKNRDFVTQRSWNHTGPQLLIMNHSVHHKAAPPTKNFIRGTSFFTGYVIESSGTNSCHVTYITQADPRGNIPSWLVNKLVTVVTPKIVDRLLKASSRYESWKKDNQPEHKPWLYPDQIATSFIDYDDVVIPDAAANGGGGEEEEEGDRVDGLKEEEFCDDNLEGLPSAIRLENTNGANS